MTKRTCWRRSFAATWLSTAGSFSEATLLSLFSVTGDGWREHETDKEGWRRYRLWRAAHGENNRFYDAPGHRFDAKRPEALSDVIAFTMALGWDAMVRVKPGGQILFLSHDDRLEIIMGLAAEHSSDSRSNLMIGVARINNEIAE